MVGTAAIAISAFSVSAQAATQTDNTDDGSTAALTAGNAAAFVAPAAGVDEIFTIADGVAVGDTGVVVSATNADGVGTLTFSGGSVATGTIGASGYALGQLNAGVSTKTVQITGNVFANDVNLTANDAVGTATVQFDADLTAATLDITNSGAGGNAVVQATTVGGALTVSGASNITAGAGGAATTALTVTGNSTFTGGITVTAGNHADADATLTLNGATNTGDITLTDATGQAALVLNGAADATVAGTITGDGDITVTAGGSNNVDFTGAVTSGTISVNTTGEVEFDAAVASTVTFDAAGTLDLDDTLTGAVDFNGNAGTVTVADGKTISGTVSDETAGTVGATLTVEGTSTFASAIGGGAANKAVNLTMTGASGKTATFEAAVDATTITVGAGAAVFDLTSDFITANVGAGDVTFTGVANGAMNFTADGTITSAAVDGLVGAVDNTSGADGVGTVTVGAATTTLGAIGATNSLKNLTLGADATSSGAVNADEIDVATSDLTVGAATTLASGQTLSFMMDANDTGNSGSIAAGGTLFTAAAGSTVIVNASEADFEALYDDATGDGGTYNFVTGSNGSATVASTVVSNIPGYTFAATTDGTVVTVTATQKAASTWTNDEKVHNSILADNDGAGTADDAMVALVDSLRDSVAQANTVAERDALLEAAQPTVDGSAQTTLIDAATEVQGIADVRMASIRNINSGIAAGNAMGHKKMWVQGYYTYADQDLREGIAGYESDTAGLMIGVDSEDIISNGVLGVAVNYGVVNADSENASTTDTEIDSYGLTLYGSMDLSQDMFVEGQVGYTHNEVETTRNACGGAGLVCNGDTESAQYSAKLALGRDYAAHKSMKVTPRVYAAYVNVDTDGYTETGTGTKLTVQDADVAALDLGLDLTAAWDIQARDGIMQPSFHAGYAYDVIGDEVETTSTFATIVSPTAFRTTGAEAAQSKFNVGMGFTYETNADWDVSAKYDAVFKEDYYAHNGTVRFSTRF